MNPFTLTNYLLIFVAIFSHYSLGKRLKVDFFISRCLVGVSCSALVVACLANVSAGLIKPYILGSIVVLGALSLYDLFQFLKNKQPLNLKVYLFLLVLGIALFLLNNPQNVFLAKDGSNEIFIDLNDHYSYFASQSIEMVNATYLGRLKIANLYPYQWGRYHFFNSSTQAVAQGLISQVGLLTFFMAQTCFMILILSSFGEQLFFRFRSLSPTSIALCIIWLLIGSTLFSDVLWWNLQTSGPFSVFAGVCLIFSIFSKKYHESLLYSCILGASAFRLIPIAFFSFFAIPALFLFERYKNEIKPSSLPIWLKKIGATNLLALFLFVTYNVLTLIASNSAEGEFIESSILNHGWLSGLISYKLLSYLTLFFSGNNFFIAHKFDGSFFQGTPVGSLFSYLFVFGLIILLGFWTYKILSSDQEVNLIANIRKELRLIFKLLSGYLLVAVLCYFIILTIHNLSSEPTPSLHPDLPLISVPYYFIISLILLHLIVAPYFIGALILLYLIHQDTPPEEWAEQRKRYYFILILLTSTLLYQYTGPNGIKAPVTYIVYDIMLWGMIGVYLFTKYKKINPTLIGITLFSVIFFNVKIINVLKLEGSPVNVTPLFQESFERSEYVDEQNMAKFDFDDPRMDDAYSAILGSNLRHSEEYRLFFRTYGFVDYSQE